MIVAQELDVDWSTVTIEAPYMVAGCDLTTPVGPSTLAHDSPRP